MIHTQRRFGKALSICIFACSLLVGSQAFSAVSEEKVAAVGQKIAKAINDQNLNALVEQVNLRALGLRVAKKMDISQLQLEGFITGFSKELKDKALQKILMQMKQDGGAAKMMRVTRRGADLRALVRLKFESGGVEYLEFVVEADERGNYRAVDWLPMTFGDLVSTMVGSVSRVMTNPDRGLLESLFGITEFDPALVTKIKKINEFERAGKYHDAVGAIDSLPPKLANAKLFVFRRVTLASVANDEAFYRKALQKLADLYGNDPSASGLLIDYYILEGKTDDAVKAIGAMQNWAGADGVTEVLKANTYERGLRYKEMLSTAKRAVELEPDLLDGHSTLASAQLRNNLYNDAIVTYTNMESQFQLRFAAEHFADDPSATEFIKSAEFKKWMRSKAK